MVLARRWAILAALVAAPAFAATTSGNCTFNLETHYVFECDSGTRGTIQGVGDPTGTSHPYCANGGGAWVAQPMLTSLACEQPANFADYQVSESQVAALLKAIVGLLALAVTIRLVRDTIRGRR